MLNQKGFLSALLLATTSNDDCMAPCRCRTAFHLACAMGAPNVLLEQDSFELWCPLHADTDNSDEDYAFTASRPRRQTGRFPRAVHTRMAASPASGVSHTCILFCWPGAGGGSSGKRQRSSMEAQRPRTDWQKKDANTWLKVVPPWWCEHRTVHFASERPAACTLQTGGLSWLVSEAATRGARPHLFTHVPAHHAAKVFKELFKSNGAAVLVDQTGAEWDCVVHSEARNDLRPQYTLRVGLKPSWCLTC